MNNAHPPKKDPALAKQANDHVWKPHATVAAVIPRDNKFLMVEEPINDHIIFNQPAGHLEDSETLTEAIIREVREETAWGFTPEYLLGLYQWQHPQKGHTYLRTTFVGSVDDHDPNQTLYDGIISATWKTLDELQSESIKLRSPLVLACIHDYLAGHQYSLEILRNSDHIA